MNRRYKKIVKSVFSLSAISLKEKMIYSSFLLIIVLFITIGYSAFNKNLDLTTLTADVRLEKLVRINNIILDTAKTSNDVDSIQDYDYNNIGISVDLPYENSYATYIIEVSNRKFNDVGILQLTNIPDNLNYEISEYNLGDRLCDNLGNCNVSDLNCSSPSCNPVVKTTIAIKFFYKENKYDSNNTRQNFLTYFEFKDIYRIKYNDFLKDISNLPNYIIGGGKLEAQFNETVNSVSIIMDGIPLGNDEYTLSNNKLIIENITGNLEITNTSKFKITFDKMGGVNGTDQSIIKVNENIDNIIPPIKDGYSFKGYYTSLDTKQIQSNINTWSETVRIDMIDNTDWLFSNEDKGRILVAKFTLTDQTKDSPPERVEFNDLEISPVIVNKGNHTWEYRVNIIISNDMVSKRSNFDYSSEYRFFDIDGTSVNTSVSVNYIYLDGIEYFDEHGTIVYHNDLQNDITLYAKWIDDIAPVLTYTSTYDINQVDVYTLNTWTNKNVYTNFSVIEKGSGLVNDKIQYSLDNGQTWNDFVFAASNGYTISNGVYQGSENWSMPSSGNIRKISALFRACDNSSNCSAVNSFNLNYDNQNPTILSNTLSYPESNGIKLTVTADDSSGSGVKSIKYGLSDNDSCSNVSYSTNNVFTSNLKKYICTYVEDNANNIVQNSYETKFILTANANGGSIPETVNWIGSGNTSTSYITYGNQYTNLPIPSRNNYTLNSWSTQPTILGYAEFSGNDYITLSKEYMYTDKISIHIEGYMENWAEYITTSSRLISCTESGGWNIESNGENISFAMYDGDKKNYNNAISSVSWSSLSSGWHTFDMVFTGTGGKLTGYLDGVEIASSSTFSGKISYNENNTIFVGAEAGDNTTTPENTGFKGKIRNVIILNSNNKIEVQNIDNTTVMNKNYNHTIYASWKTNKFTWKKYNIHYEAYNTGETPELTSLSTLFYVANNYTINSNGTATLNMDKMIYWAAFTGGNEDDAPGYWLSSISLVSKNDTSATTFYHIKSAVYWLPKFTIKTEKWQIRPVKDSDTGEIVSSYDSSIYPSDGVKDGYWYILQ